MVHNELSQSMHKFYDKTPLANRKQYIVRQYNIVDDNQFAFVNIPLSTIATLVVVALNVTFNDYSVRYFVSNPSFAFNLSILHYFFLNNKFNYLATYQ